MSFAVTAVEGILVEVDESVATILLNRPEQMNTLTRKMISGLWDLLLDLDDDESVRAVVIGAKGKFFSAGVALEPGSVFTGRPVAYNHRPHELRTPIIGALGGAAVGLGLTLALQWDVRFVAEEAKYGFVFTRRGVLPEVGSAWLLPRMVGVARATDLLLSGRHFTGREAVDWGIALEALPADQVLGRAQSYAREIADHASPLMVGATKRMLRSMIEMPDFSDALDLDERCYEWVRRISEKDEGIASFLEKRPPNWPHEKMDHLPEELMNVPSKRLGAQAAQGVEVQ